MYKTPPKSAKLSSPSHHSDTDIQKLCQEELLLPDFSKNASNRAKRRRPSNEEITDELAVFKEEMRDLIRQLFSTQNSRLDKLENHFIEIKKQYSHIETTNNEIEKSMTSLCNQLTSLESKITCLEQEKGSVAIQLSTLEEKIDSLDRNLIKTCIELRNVPKKQRETKSDLFTMVTQLSETLNIKLQATEIRDVVRLPSKKEFSSVKVEFQNTLTKFQFLKSAKAYNNKNSSAKLNSVHVGFKDPKSPLYVAEHLSAKANRLFFVSRNFAKSHNFAYCWTANGRIMLRKDNESAYILVKNESQLQELAKSIKM